MQTLYFLVTIFTIFWLFIRILVQLIRKRPVIRTIKILTTVFALYVSLWVIFYFKASNLTIPLGTDICFDDWCATITSYKKTEKIGNLTPHGLFIILSLKMTNNARRIAQKPSEPRVHIIDYNNHSWSLSIDGQLALENIHGPLYPIDQKLEVHQSLETKLVFDVPKNSSTLHVLIEEGPFITKLLLRSNKKVFQIQ